MNSRHHCRQRGGAAVELAFVLLTLFLSMAAILFLSRYMWHYTATQKAAQDGAYYLSRISEQEMRDVYLVRNAAALSKEIAETEVKELYPGGLRPDVAIRCSGPCTGVGGQPLPQTISVEIDYKVTDPFLGFDTGLFGKPISVTSELNYVGN